MEYSWDGYIEESQLGRWGDMFSDEGETMRGPFCECETLIFDFRHSQNSKECYFHFWSDDGSEDFEYRGWMLPFSIKQLDHYYWSNEYGEDVLVNGFDCYTVPFVYKNPAEGRVGVHALLVLED